MTGLPDTNSGNLIEVSKKLSKAMRHYNRYADKYPTSSTRALKIKWWNKWQKASVDYKRVCENIMNEAIK